MKFISILKVGIFLAGSCLIILHGLYPTRFIVDEISILILFLMSIPVVAYYLRKAKFLGAEFEFREEIEQARNFVQVSTKRLGARKLGRDNKKAWVRYKTFRLGRIKEMLEEDHILALAALNIEIRKKVKLAIKMLGFPTGPRGGVQRYINMLGEAKYPSGEPKYIYPEQVQALRRIIKMCNKAIRGASVTVQEAREIIELADELNGTFPIGYSIDFTPNLDFEKHGFLCEWEHCIEYMPLRKTPEDASCPVFDHECPGGTQRVTTCNKTIEDIPPERFISKKRDPETAASNGG